MYRDTLADQWKNLCSDFAQEYDRLAGQGEEQVLRSFARWYETRIHRWQSVAYPEGIILEQTEREEFAHALTGTMEDFRFEVVEKQPGRPLWQGIALSLAAGLGAALLIWLLRWDTVRVVLSGVVVCVVAALGFMRSETAAKERESKRVKEAYVDQLREYGQKLADLCEQFEV